MTYTITDTNIYTNHSAAGPSALSVVADGEQQSSNLRLDAMVKSGDYFATLATALDSLPDHPKVDQLVNELLYLQSRYEIVTKKK